MLPSATTTNGLTVTGHINSTPRIYYNLFFLVNDACDASGYGEGQDFVGDITIIADENGDYQFTATFPTASVPPGKFISASASNPESTSEFSLCIEVVEGGPTPTPGPVRLHGDIRCDGGVDATDGLGILREVAGMTQIAQTEPCPDLGDNLEGRIFGDVLCNGGIDAVDALAVLRFVAGLPPLSAGIGCPDVGEEV